MEFIQEQLSTPVRESYDVIVVGGGKTIRNDRPRCSAPAGALHRGRICPVRRWPMVLRRKCDRPDVAN